VDNEVVGIRDWSETSALKPIVIMVVPAADVNPPARVGAAPCDAFTPVHSRELPGACSTLMCAVPR
jgi:hypothetical protein